MTSEPARMSYVVFSWQNWSQKAVRHENVVQQFCSIQNYKGYISASSLQGLLSRNTNCHTQKLRLCILNLFPHLKQGREHMKCINCTGTIGVAHELVDVATPGFLCIVTCCWLKCSKDGRKKWWGRRGGISINISKTEGENRKRWWKENTKKVADKIYDNREIKSQIQLQHLPKNIHEFSNYFWKLTGCWLQWEKPPNQNPYLQAIIICLPSSQNTWIVFLYHHFAEESWNFTGD